MYLTKLITEDWAQLWPNVFAISIWTVLLFIAHHVSLRRHIDRRHEELKAHVSAAGQPNGDDLSSGNEEAS